MAQKRVFLGITQSNFGGAQRHVFDLANAFRTRFDVAVIHGGHSELAKRLDEARIPRHEIRSLGRHVAIVGDVQTFFELIGLLRTEKPDIFHVHSSKMGFLGALAGRIVGVQRIIFTAHAWEFNAPRPAYERIVIYLISLAIVVLAHRTIAVSSHLKQQMPRFLRGKITVIHNGIQPVSVMSRDEARTSLRKFLPNLPDGTWIGTIAELHPVKGINHAIVAMKDIITRHPDARYIVLGDGSERTSLGALVEKHGLTQHVYLAGFVPDAARLLSAFDIFVLPTLSEGLSYAVLEAGSASFPVVVSNVGGIPEIIEHGVHGTLVPPRDPGEIASAISQLLMDRELTERYGAALRDRVLRQFSLEQMIEATSVCYEEA